MTDAPLQQRCMPCCASHKSLSFAAGRGADHAAADAMHARMHLPRYCSDPLTTSDHSQHLVTPLTLKLTPSMPRYPSSSTRGAAARPANARDTTAGARLSGARCSNSTATDSWLGGTAAGQTITAAQLQSSRYALLMLPYMLPGECDRCSLCQ